MSLRVDTLHHLPVGGKTAINVESRKFAAADDLAAIDE
jgi:hypothetical protein